MAASKYASIKTSVADLLTSGLGPFLADFADGRGKHAPSALLGQQLTRAFQTYYAFKTQLENETIDCAIMAITKSGKSTFINASTGAAILPSNNVPETARVVSIEHTNLASEEKPYLTYSNNNHSIRVEGESEIYSHLEYCNKETRSRPHRKEDEQVLAININIAALPRGESEQQCRLRLLDTPGTNEANEDRLRHSVERLLDTVDAVVYILDYTKLKTSEEASLLASLKAANPQLVQRLAQRLFFVVNKVDCMHSNIGLQEDELREYVADLITKQMNSPAFQLRPEQVMLVSAHEALLARLVLAGKASEDDQRMFSVKAWGSSWARKKQRKSDEEMRRQAVCMLEDSRLPELEQRLFSYLYNNAGGLKLMALLDNMSRLLNEVHNGAATGLAALQQSASEVERETGELQSSLDDTMGKFDTIQRDAEQIEHNVTDNVQARMQTLKEKIFAHVNEVLNGVEEPVLPAVRSGPWKKAWEKASKFLRRGSSEAASDSELKEKLQELHNDINSQISNEIQQFWRDLEVATNAKHQSLIIVLNRHIESLARAIEDVVGSVLNLKLEPICIDLEPPDAQQFHQSIQDLFQSGIGRSTRLEKEAREEDYTQWETRYRGLCRTTQYYVGLPAKRWVEYDKEVTTFQLNTDKIKEYFHNMVEVTVNTSIKHVRAYVHAYLSDNIEAARERISGYGKMYSDIMHAALEMKSHSLEEQDAGIKTLKAQVKTITSLLAECASLQDQAAQLVPEAKAGEVELAGHPCEPAETYDSSKEKTAEVMSQSGDDEGDDEPIDLLPEEFMEAPPTDVPAPADLASSIQEKPAAVGKADSDGQKPVDSKNGEDAVEKEGTTREQSNNKPKELSEADSVAAAMKDLDALGMKSEKATDGQGGKDQTLPTSNPPQQTEASRISYPTSKNDAEEQAALLQKLIDEAAFWGFEYDCESQGAHATLPVSKGPEDDSRKAGSSAGDSADLPHPVATLSSGIKAPQSTPEEHQPETQRQDSLDSSEWECLSHEQYSAEAHD